MMAEYFACFDRTWTEETPVEKVRFVVLDSETTGLDPRRDRLITLGAVAVVDQEILLGDSFEVLMPIAHNFAAVTVHGITRDEAETGLKEPEALRQFLVYLKDGIIVGHHIGHDIAMLNAGYRRHFGFELRNRSLDTMDLTLHLERAGAFAESRKNSQLRPRHPVRPVRHRAARPSHCRGRCLPHRPDPPAPPAAHTPFPAPYARVPV